MLGTLRLNCLTGLHFSSMLRLCYGYVTIMLHHVVSSLSSCANCLRTKPTLENGTLLRSLNIPENSAVGLKRSLSYTSQSTLNQLWSSKLYIAGCRPICTNWGPTELRSLCKNCLQTSENSLYICLRHKIIVQTRLSPPRHPPQKKKKRKHNQRRNGTGGKLWDMHEDLKGFI